jgi:hypothetical protein
LSLNSEIRGHWSEGVNGSTAQYNEETLTTKGKAPYAISLGWPEKESLLTSLPEGKPLWFGRIRQVRMLGVDRLF